MGLPVLVALDFSHAPPIQGPCCRAIAIVPIKNTRVPEDVSRMLFGVLKLAFQRAQYPVRKECTLNIVRVRFAARSIIYPLV